MLLPVERRFMHMEELSASYGLKLGTDGNSESTNMTSRPVHHLQPSSQAEQSLGSGTPITTRGSVQLMPSISYVSIL